MMSRQHIGMIAAAVVAGVACLGVGACFLSAFMASKAAEAQRNESYETLEKCYQAKIFPSDENVARIAEDQNRLGEWMGSVSNLLHKGDLKIHAYTPVRFKQILQDSVREMQGQKGGAGKGRVAEDFKFGFDKYLGESDSLPQKEHVARLAEQLDIIHQIVAEMYAANIVRLDQIEREVFEGGGDPALNKPKEESGRRRPRRSEPTSPERVTRSASADPMMGRLCTKQRVTVAFTARPAALSDVLNRLAAMDLFVVVADLEFKKTDDPLSRQDVRKKDAAASARGGEKTVKEVDVSALPVADRIVTDPELEPPMGVRISLDVYSFKGV